MMRILFCYFVLVGLLFAGQAIKIGFVRDMPPYTLPNNTGIEIELIKEILEPLGYSVEPVFLSFKRGKYAVANNEIDGMTTMTDDGHNDVLYSNEYIQYHNVAITLKDKNIQINKILDLKGLSIIAWQNAHTALGDEYYRLFNPEVKDEYTKKYREIVEQIQQNKLFWSGRTDTIILDEKIFLYYKKVLQNELNTNQEYELHDIFGGATNFKVAFNNEKLTNDFNKGLDIIKKNGTYQKILNKYK